MSSYIRWSKIHPFSIAMICILFLIWILCCADDSNTPGYKDKRSSADLGSRTSPNIPKPKELEPESYKISPSIRSILAEMEARNMTRQNARELGASNLSNPFVRVNEEGSIQIYIHVLTFGPEERAQLESYEVVIEIANEKLKIIQAWIPFNRIYEIAQLPFVKRIKAPSYATPRVGSVTTEGDTILSYKRAKYIERRLYD